jgi:hypothetical protein
MVQNNQEIELTALPRSAGVGATSPVPASDKPPGNQFVKLIGKDKDGNLIVQLYDSNGNLCTALLGKDKDGNPTFSINGSGSSIDLPNIKAIKISGGIVYQITGKDKNGNEYLALIKTDPTGKNVKILTVSEDKDGNVFFELISCEEKYRTSVNDGRNCHLQVMSTYETVYDKKEADWKHDNDKLPTAGKKKDSVFSWAHITGIFGSIAVVGFMGLACTLCPLVGAWGVGALVTAVGVTGGGAMYESTDGFNKKYFNCTAKQTTYAAGPQEKAQSLVKEDQTEMDKTIRSIQLATSEVQVDVNEIDQTSTQENSTLGLIGALAQPLQLRG